MKISEIKPCPWNTRSEITEASVKTLAESMKADGLIQPISVCDAEDGDGYVCYDGNRRLAAAALLGWKEIAANYSDLTIAEAKVRTVTANIQREDDDPLLAAKVIGELLDAGEKPEQIASKLGKTTPWVRRRAKLCALAPEVAEKIVGKVTLDALEKIAVMPPKAQANLVKAVERRASYANGALVTVADIRWDIQREQADLDGAPFDMAKCKRCEKRTGAQPDLWGETDGNLGHCNDCACFREKVKAHEDALIAAATQGVKDVERVDGDWAIPNEADADRPTRKKPTAYAYIDDDGAAVVKYGPSRAAIDAAREAEWNARDAEREADNAERKREREIVHKFTDAMNQGETADKVREKVEDLISVCPNLDESQTRFVVDCVVTNITEQWNDGEIAEVLTAFPFARELCGISDEDAEWFVERNAPKDDGDGE